MNLARETLYPGNAKRPLNPTDFDGARQVTELKDFKLAWGLPRGIDAIANLLEIGYGPTWKDPRWNRPGPPKTWQSNSAVVVTVPGLNPDNSYKMAPFVPGTGFDFSKWNRAVAEFYESWYGNFFKFLPILETQGFNAEQAADTNYAVGPTASYPLATADSPMGPLNAVRFDENGNIKIFKIAEFRAANPVVGEQPHIIPPPFPGGISEQVMSIIAQTASNKGFSLNERATMIRGLLGAPIPGGGTPANAV